MILLNITAWLIGVSLTCLLIGLLYKKKIIKIIGIVVIIAVIIFWFGFFIWAIYEDDRQYRNMFPEDFEIKNQNTAHLEEDMLKENKNSFGNTSNIENILESDNNSKEKLNSIENTSSIKESKSYSEFEKSELKNYLGKKVSYNSAVELLNKFINEYKNNLSNSESDGTTGIYVYLSANINSDEMLKDSIVSSIESYLNARKDDIEGTYTINVGNNEKYGKYIYIQRNELQMLRGSFKIEPGNNGLNDNYKYIDIYNKVLSSKSFLEKVSNKYGIDLTNKVKVWSLTLNNFLINIGCDEIDPKNYSQYTDYIFEVFNNEMKQQYNLELIRMGAFSKVVQ